MNTVIFDLDGTLLPMDPKKFLDIYLGELGKKLSDILPPEKTIQYIWESTGVMLKNDGKQTNGEIFFRHFKSLVGEKYDDCLTRFDDFYKNEYGRAKAATAQNKTMIKSVYRLKEKGYKLVVATNPLFPKYATHQRLEWAGFTINDFDYISNFEENCSSKPNPAFYSEILQKIDKEAIDCLMVGNDVHEDLIACEVGIKTYLITDHMLNSENRSIKADHIGNYEDFYTFVQSLPDYPVHS